MEFNGKAPLGRVKWAVGHAWPPAAIEARRANNIIQFVNHASLNDIYFFPKIVGQCFRAPKARLHLDETGLALVVFRVNT